MIKKIITGILITAVLSLAATGTIYAYQKEQPALDSAPQSTQSQLLYTTAGQRIAACRRTGNYNDGDIPGTGNRYQQGKIYRENEKNDCPEPAENNYLWKHNYNHKNENCGNDNCFEYNYKYEHNYRYENSCDYCGDRTCQAQNRNGSRK